jgi:hypothetical protein
VAVAWRAVVVCSVVVSVASMTIIFLSFMT